MIKAISLNETDLIQSFLSSAGDSLKSFRYFNKRPLSVISNHLVTALLLTDGMPPLGYGHLDKEADDIWLGIAIAEAARGTGMGKLMMQYLMLTADKHKLKLIKLTVDKENTVAIQLYTQFGFSIVKELNEFSLLMECIKQH